MKLEEEKRLKEAALLAAKHKQQRRRNRKGGGKGKKSLAKKTADEEEFMGEIQRYVQEREARLMMTAKGAGPGTGSTVPKTSGMKSQYEFELHQINANDPNNWDIDSGNRQRELYGHLYHEIDHKAVAVGAMAVVDSKIKLVLKGTEGGLPAYTQQLVETAEVDRAKLQHKLEVLAAQVPTAPLFMDEEYLQVTCPLNHLTTP